MRDRTPPHLSTHFEPLVLNKYWDLSELLGGGCRWDMEFLFAQFKLRFQIQIPNCFL